MMHRIRLAMTEFDTAKLTGIVESDETWVGGVRRGKGSGYTHNKTAVQALVQRDGPLRVRAIGRVTVRNLRNVLAEHVDDDATLMTDDWKGYKVIARRFKGHESVNHTAGEYSRGDCHVNSAEGFFALVKRGLHGIYHSVSKNHLHRYLAEFEFRYNGRDLEDG